MSHKRGCSKKHRIQKYRRNKDPNLHWGIDSKVARTWPFMTGRDGDVVQDRVAPLRVYFKIGIKIAK